MKNILITSAGRRVSLVRAFQSELKLSGIQAKVFTCDQNPSMSAACCIADESFEIPPVKSEKYLEKLLNLCKKQKIGLIIPTIDTELLILSKNKNIFKRKGINIIISSTNIVQVSEDKRLTSDFFNNLGIDTPKIFNTNEIKFPAFAKPYNGSNSKNLYKLASKDDLTNSILSDDDLIFMEYIDQTYNEITVDAYYDKNHVLKCLVPRERLEVRDGEVSKGITRKGHFYNAIKRSLEVIDGAVGTLTIQFFFHPTTKDIKGIEINARFGGGYPLSYKSGANYPKWIIEEYLLDQEIDFYENWKENNLMLRFDEEIVLVNGN